MDPQTLDWIKEDVKERTSKPRNYKQNTCKWIGNYPNNIWCVDLIDFSKSWNHNRYYKYIFIAVDIYSRYAFAYPMKEKSEDAIKAAIEYCIDKANDLLPDAPTRVKPNKICSDRERGLISLIPWLQEKNIVLYHANGKYKAVIVEAFIRTFKEMLSYHVTYEKRTLWIDHYKDVIDKYNNKQHSALRTLINERPVRYKYFTPYEIYTGQEEYTEIEEPRKLKGSDVTERFHPGDIVRFKYDKSMFPLAKQSLLPNYSKDIFRVVSVDPSPNPKGYRLKRLTNRGMPDKYPQHRFEVNNASNRLFYHHELKKSKMMPGDVASLPNESKTY